MAGNGTQQSPGEANNTGARWCGKPLKSETAGMVKGQGGKQRKHMGQKVSPVVGKSTIVRGQGNNQSRM